MHSSFWLLISPYFLLMWSLCTIYLSVLWKLFKLCVFFLTSEIDVNAGKNNLHLWQSSNDAFWDIDFRIAVHMNRKFQFFGPWTTPRTYFWFLRNSYFDIHFHLTQEHRYVTILFLPIYTTGNNKFLFKKVNIFVVQKEFIIAVLSLKNENKTFFTFILRLHLKPCSAYPRTP